MFNKQNGIILLLFILALILAGVFFFLQSRSGFFPSDMAINQTTRDILPGAETKNQRFLRDGLTTDTSKASIPLDRILSGGPSKDGIPSINDPKFTSIADASSSISDDTFGLLLTVGETTRFYPFNILVWHEIVNDVVEGRPLAVTFCPLCGSAIAYDATLDGEPEIFGVSGKLFESNLLMYDKKTESLWSQSRGEAVVGERLGTKLEIYPAQMLSFADVKNTYPEAEILSDKTGHIRDYRGNPYGNYNENDDIYFPVSVRDTRYPLKELMYVVPFGEQSAAFPLKDIPAEGSIELAMDGATLKATQVEHEYHVTVNGEGEPLPGYFEMWFSWAQHHQEDGIVWSQ